MTGRNGVTPLSMAVACVIAVAGFARAQTVGEAAKLPEDGQRQILMRFVDTSVTNLRSRSDTTGRPKSDEEYSRDRMLANLVRALFVQDPASTVAPEGPRTMLGRIKRFSAETPDRTVLDVMGDLVDWCWKHFYTDFYTPEKKAEFARKSDADQEALFRLNLMLYENERIYQRTMKSLDDRAAALRRKMQDMYDDAILLADGRHVLRTNEGAFMVIVADPGGKDVRLEDRFVPEAQGLYDCMRTRGLKSGREARVVCAAGSPPGGAVPVRTGYLLNGRKVTLDSLGRWVYENGDVIAKELIAVRTGMPNLQPVEQAPFATVRQPHDDIQQVVRSVKPCVDDTHVRHSDFLFGMTETGVVSASSASTAGGNRFELSYYGVLANLDFGNVRVSPRSECVLVNVPCKATAQCVQLNDEANVLWSFWVNTAEQANRVLTGLRAIAPHYPRGEAEMVPAR